MGKSTPQVPTPPDPTALSNAQAGANKDTAVAQARLNAVNQNSPFGTVSYSETPNASDPSVPNFTQNVSLSPDQQQLYDTQTGIEKQAYNTAGQALSTAQGTLSTPFTLNNLPDLVTGVNAGQPQTGYNAVNPLFGIAPAGNVQSSLSPSGPIQSSINTSGLPNVPLSANDFAAQGDATTNALMQRFNTDWANQQENTNAQLNAQGAQAGSKQYDIANQQLDRARNDAMSQALLAGNQEQNTLFNQSLASNQNLFGQRQAQGTFTNAAQQQGFNQNAQSGQFANEAQAQQFGQNTAQQQAFNEAAQQQTQNNQNQATFANTAQGQAFAQALQNATLQNQGRQQSVAEQQLLRSQPINEIAALLGLGSGIQTPTGAPNFGVNIGNTDVLGAYGLNQQAQQNAYNQQMQSNNAITGALGNLAGSLGGAAILHSDRRLKTNIRRVGRTPRGVPLYRFAYKDNPTREIVGPMAQDMIHIDPLAVHEKGGFLLVDYARVA